MPAAPPAAKSTRKFHFISGMPRSGTTLLAAILNQNPRFRAGMTSPLADIMGVVMAETSSKNDFSFDVSDEHILCTLRIKDKHTQGIKQMSRCHIFEPYSRSTSGNP